MTKPLKPYEGFPLTPHNCKKWCKKINGGCSTLAAGLIGTERSRNMKSSSMLAESWGRMAT